MLKSDEYIVICFLKKICIHNQCYQLAAILRDREKSLGIITHIGINVDKLNYDQYLYVINFINKNKLEFRDKYDSIIEDVLSKSIHIIRSKKINDLLGE
jgi:hypothetical protein